MYAVTRNSVLGAWGYRHPYVVTGIRAAAGIWNLILGSFFLAQGYEWAWVLFAVAAVIFTAAYVLARGTSGTRRNGQS